MIYIRQLFSAVLLVLWLALNSILNVFLQNWQVYNPGRGKKTSEDNTDRYRKKPDRDLICTHGRIRKRASSGISVSSKV